METKKIESPKDKAKTKDESKQATGNLPPCPSCGGNDVHLHFGTYEKGVGGGLSWAGINCSTLGCEVELHVSAKTEIEAMRKALRVWGGNVESKPESPPLVKTPQERIIDAHNNAVKQIAKHQDEIKRLEKELISFASKSPHQLYKELGALPNDAQRWEWVKENKNQAIKLSLDNDSTDVYLYNEQGEYMERVGFSDTIGSDRGITYLLESLGISHDYWD